MPVSGHLHHLNIGRSAAAVSDFKEFNAERKNIRNYAAAVYPWLAVLNPNLKGKEIRDE